MSNILVAYFSTGGNTAQAAKTLADVTGADLYEIQPKVPYTTADLNWSDPNARTTKENTDPNCRPELANHDAPVDGHDIVFLGFPIWWHQAPAIVRSFLDAYDFSGKRIILFSTSEGSKLERALPEIQAIVPNAKVEAGIIANWPHNSAASLEKWVKSLGI